MWSASGDYNNEFLIDMYQQEERLVNVFWADLAVLGLSCSSQPEIIMMNFTFPWTGWRNDDVTLFCLEYRKYAFYMFFL